MLASAIRYCLPVLLIGLLPYGAVACEVDGKTLPCSNAAEQFIERLHDCVHLAGEVGGGEPEREAELSKQINELHCDHIVCDYTKIHSAKKGTRSDKKVLDAALAEITREDYGGQDDFFENFATDKCPAPADYKPKQQ
ncbi:MAG TPA: hypothetical protein VFT64_00895 [Rickettsiales bacterium]|nr:hypothetical protein [Rickettsiales bacterium]